MKSDVYPTRDIGLAATLVTLRFRITGITYQYEGTRPQPVGYFEFQDTENLQKAIQNYWKGELVVEPRQFLNNMRGLKAEVSNVYKNPYTEQAPTPKA